MSISTPISLEKEHEAKMEKLCHSSNHKVASIANAVKTLRPLTMAEGQELFTEFRLADLQIMADYRRKMFHGEHVFYNKNVHLEPTNKCAYSCKFCSFYRKPKATVEQGAWDYSLEEIVAILQQYQQRGLTEVHVTGGVHPYRDLDYWSEVLQTIKQQLPGVHVKAYTAVEIAYMARKAKKPIKEVLIILQKAGLDSLPGGGAEIFDKHVRKKIAGAKAPAMRWLEIHKSAHEIGISSNATMLYGHIESIDHRLDHMLKIRDLQEKTGGFHCFIPLKYRNENNALSELDELSIEDDLRNYAVSRLMMHNIRHLKAYWVMLGLPTAQQSLHYGVDDLDGTVNDTTKIYSMAGSIEHPSLTSLQLRALIQKENLIPIERNSVYEPLEQGM